MRCYTELVQLHTFEERFKYLSLLGTVGNETFGFDRYLNQKFYKSIEWKRIRNFVIVRDNGCDMGLRDYPIGGKIMIHHMNPVSAEDLESSRWDDLLNPEFLISVSMDTHNAIHYGDEKILNKVDVVERIAGDTIPWR
jgi:hypothetical protein